MDIVEHIVQIIPQKVCQRLYRTNAEDVHPLGLDDGVDSGVEFLPVQNFAGFAQLLHVGMEHHGDNVLISQPVIGYLNALDGGQPVQYHLLHGFLHTGVAVKAQIHRKTHHRGFRYPYGFSQPVGGHKRGLVVGLRNIAGNAPLALGKGRILLL